MIGLDTNILVRYLVQDDPDQSRKAAHIMEHTLSESRLGFVSLVSMVELVWVLQSVYSFSDARIVAALERILQAEVLSVQNEAEVFVAMTAWKEGRASFADALVGALGIWAGCETTLTFDRKASRLGVFRLA